MVFESIAGTAGFLTDAAIDDISIDKRGPCQVPVSCTFEDSLCLWSHEPSDDNPKFYRISPFHLRDLDPDNKITMDYTTRTQYGHLLWLKSSDPSTTQKTRLYSETLVAQRYLYDTCLTFAATLGPNSEIKVSRKFYESPVLSTEYRLVGPESGMTEWKRYKVPLSRSLINYEFYVEVTVGLVGLDDIIFHKQECNTLEDEDDGTKFKCKDGTFIPMSKVCDFIRDCAGGGDESPENQCGNCDFESSTCNYKNYGSSDTISLQWERVQAIKSNNGPNIDSTTQSELGHYAYLVTDGGSFLAFGTLQLKQTLKRCSASCELHFYYHMYGKSDDLKVFNCHSFFTP